jgi:hypothetical protein
MSEVLAGNSLNVMSEPLSYIKGPIKILRIRVPPLHRNRPSFSIGQYPKTAFP